MSNEKRELNSSVAVETVEALGASKYVRCWRFVKGKAPHVAFALGLALGFFIGVSSGTEFFHKRKEDVLMGKVDDLERELAIASEKNRELRCSLGEDVDCIAETNTLVMSDSQTAGDVERRLRELIVRCPVASTNLALIGLAYDIHGKEKVRNYNVALQMVELNRLFKQICVLIDKNARVQLLKRKADDVILDMVLAFGSANDFRVHFAEHISENANMKMLHNLLDDAQTFSLRMSADSKSLQNARAIVSEIVQIDALSHDTFEQMRAIIRAHIETCGKKQ